MLRTTRLACSCPIIVTVIDYCIPTSGCVGVPSLSPVSSTGGKSPL